MWLPEHFRCCETKVWPDVEIARLSMPPFREHQLSRIEIPGGLGVIDTATAVTSAVQVVPLLVNECVTTYRSSMSHRARL